MVEKECLVPERVPVNMANKNLFNFLIHHSAYYHQLSERTEILKKTFWAASHYSKSKTTKSIVNTGLNSYAEYSDSLSTSTYSRFAKKNDLADSLLAADPYSSKSFSSTTANTGSSSFFKRSMITNTPSTTITGKSSAPKRNVGIKVNLFFRRVVTWQNSSNSYVVHLKANK